MPLVSVILPVYNTEKYIRDSVQSILDQTFKDFELIIINDASTDGTLNVLKKFNDSRIRLLSNKINQGISKNANLGLDLAKGEFIARIDADDIAHIQRIEKQVIYLQSNPDVDFCGTWVQLIGVEDKIIRTAISHEYIKAGLLFMNVIFNPSVMYRKESFINKALRYDESYKIEDYPMWINAIDIIKFANIPTVLQKYRIHNTNISVFQNENKDELNEFHHKVYRKNFDKIGLLYDEGDLNTHREIGLWKLNPINKKQLTKYLLWLEKLIIFNDKVNYYNRSALCYEIIVRLFFLTTKSPITLWYMIFNTLIKLFTLKDYKNYFLYRANMKKYDVANF